MVGVRVPVRRGVALAFGRLRRGGWVGLGWTARLTVAAVASYVVALGFFPRGQPLLAPLTALLVVQLTPVSLLASGLDRVLSVIAGVSIAATFSAAVQLTWWSLGIVIAVSILVGQVLRLGSNLVEVPISAMLVMGVGSLSAESAAWQRISETLVGAGVGVASNLLFPPRVRAQDAGSALDAVADRLAALLDRAGDELANPDTGSGALADLAAGWMDDARRLTHELPGVGTALLRAEESRRLNLRAVGTVDRGPGLRQGMEALEHSAIAVRSMFRSILDAVRAGTWPDDDVGHALRGAVAVALHDFATGLRAFGRLVRVDAEPRRDQPGEIDDLRHALEGLLEARARLTDLVLGDDDPVRSELNFALLATAKRLLSELDLDERIRRQSDLAPSPLARMIGRATHRGHRVGGG